MTTVLPTRVLMVNEREGYRMQFSSHCTEFTIPEGGGFHVISALCAVTTTRPRETRDSNHTHCTSQTQSGRQYRGEISRSLHELGGPRHENRVSKQSGTQQIVPTQLHLTNKTHNKLMGASLHTIIANRKVAQQTIYNSPHAITASNL